MGHVLGLCRGWVVGLRQVVRGWVLRLCWIQGLPVRPVWGPGLQVTVGRQGFDQSGSWGWRG